MLQRTVLLPLFLAASLGLGGCISVSLFGPQRGELQEKLVYGERGAKILLIEIEGVLSEADGLGRFGVPGRESTVARVRDQLDKAREDDAVRALLLRIDTPGGTVTASEILYRELVRFKRERKVPVVAQLMGTATSGGYYVAMAADAIHAHPTTVTGSIGVIFTNVSVAGLMEKLGIEDQTLTGGARKDAGSPLRRMTPEEREQLQSVVDDLHARFRAVVVAGRPGLTREAIDQLADGRIFSASQAAQLGLVDRINGLPGTVAEAERLAGLTESRVVSFHRPGEWRSNLYSAEAPVAPAASLAARLGLGGGPAFLYLWWPGAAP